MEDKAQASESDVGKICNYLIQNDSYVTKYNPCGDLLKRGYWLTSFEFSTVLDSENLYIWTNKTKDAKLIQNSIKPQEAESCRL